MKTAVVVVSRLIGTAAAGLLLYDAHKAGATNSAAKQKLAVAESLPDVYVDSRKQNNSSAIGSKLKDWNFKMRMDNNFGDFFNSISGYVSGAFGSLADNVIPAALTAGAIIFPKAGVACSAGLALFGAKSLLFDTLGIGKKKYFTERV